MDLVRRYIYEILRVYSKSSFKKENILVKRIKTEDIQTYAEELRDLIQNEIKNKLSQHRERLK